MNNIRFASVLKTDNNAYWYSLGNWKLSSVPDGVPSILAYVAKEHTNSMQANQKTINVNDIEYLKVYGQPLSIYKSEYISLQKQKNVIYDQSFGKVVFVKPERIIEVRDPKEAFLKYVSDSSPYCNHLKQLTRIFGITSDNFGVSGSCLLFDSPTLRHELDFVVYGIEASRNVFLNIQYQRQIGTFSSSSIPPFHLPFQYRKLWFDPQFSEGDGEKHFLDNCKIEIKDKVRNISFSITDVRDSIFCPARYSTSLGLDLISFRPGHRGLFINNQVLHFPSLSTATIEAQNGSQIQVLVVIEDEWTTLN